MKFTKRTHTCGQLTMSDVGKTVTLNGWVSQIRDLGGVIFVNLRDRYGITQLTFVPKAWIPTESMSERILRRSLRPSEDTHNPDKSSAYEISKKLMNEYVVSASGAVQKRTSANPNLKTGEIEVLVDDITILNPSEVPPFVVEENIAANEDLRLKYRYLELRRDSLKDNLILRNEVIQVVHNYFHKLGFIEVETPILMKSTPEGARDYLVPSRIHKGKFYALPQSPQTFKQILMIAGFDRYVQLSKCFRDEDLRADRQPEFTQIDLEMSFVTQEDVFEVVEGCMKEIWKKTKGIEIKTPFKRMTYDEAINNYGTDKPDLRYGLRIINITDEVKSSGFKLFSDAVKGGGIVAGINLESAASGKEVTRKKIDELTEYVKTLGFGGLIHIKFLENEISSPLKKYLSDEILTKLKDKFSAKSGDAVFILFGEREKVCESLGKLRIKLSEEYYSNKLQNKFEFLWVTDFLLFEWDESEKKISPSHHPFTSPKEEYLKYLDSDNIEEILKIKADCYDLVLNGNELGSGSIRIHNSDIQSKIFKLLGLTKEEAQQKFGFLLEAFKYGAPPHGGAAFGFDRIVALLAGQTSIKEFIAFPKTLNAVSLMDDCPSEVDSRQLDELGIQLKN